MIDSLLELVLEVEAVLLPLLLTLNMFDTEFGARIIEDRLEVLLLEILNDDLLDQFASEPLLDFELSKTCEEFGEDRSSGYCYLLRIGKRTSSGSNEYFRNESILLLIIRPNDGVLVQRIGEGVRV